MTKHSAAPVDKVSEEDVLRPRTTPDSARVATMLETSTRAVGVASPPAGTAAAAQGIGGLRAVGAEGGAFPPPPLSSS